MKKITFILLWLGALNTSAQFVGTPYMPVITGDQIRSALSTAGCASCAAYDAAPSNTLVEITLNEYNSILTNVSGAAKKGYMGNMATSYPAFGTTGGTNYLSTGTVDALLTNSYIAAASFQVYSPVTGHIQVTAAASPTSAVTCLTSVSSPINWTAYVTKFFAVKKPTTHSGSNTYVGHVNSSGVLYSTYPVAGIGCYYGNNTCGGTSPSSHPYAIAFQVIATTTKSW